MYNELEGSNAGTWAVFEGRGRTVVSERMSSSSCGCFIEPLSSVDMKNLSTRLASSFAGSDSWSVSVVALRSTCKRPRTAVTPAHSAVAACSHTPAWANPQMRSPATQLPVCSGAEASIHA